MPLESMTRMLAKASAGGYAVGYFESWNMESLYGVLEAAEELSSPVIAGFGGMLPEERWLNQGGIRALGVMGRWAVEQSLIPAAFIFNEAVSLDQVRIALESGFNTVSMDLGDQPIEENISLTKELVLMAHNRSAAAEGAVGSLPTAHGEETDSGRPTEPDEAQRFVEATGIDALAVSFGNVHCLLEGKSTVDFDRLRRIQKTVNVPLVVHGGSGFPDEAIREAISCGVAKFNVGTILKQTFLEGIQDETVRNEQYELVMALGTRKRGDVLSAARDSMKEQVKRLIRLYGSAGKAEGW